MKKTPRRGRRGIRGPAGPAGPAGKSGDVGATGPQGERGLTGATGPRGERGLPGATGQRGLPGLAAPPTNVKAIVAELSEHVESIYKELEIQMKRMAQIQMEVDELRRKIQSLEQLPLVSPPGPLGPRRMS